MPQQYRCSRNLSRHILPLDINNAAWYFLYMAKQAPSHTSIVLTADDKQVIRRVAKKLQPKYGKIGTTGVIRASIRIAEGQAEAKMGHRTTEEV